MWITTALQVLVARNEQVMGQTASGKEVIIYRLSLKCWHLQGWEIGNHFMCFRMYIVYVYSFLRLK